MKFFSLLQCTCPADFEKFVYGHPLSNEERKSFQAKLTQQDNSKGLAPDKKMEINFQLAVLGMSSSDPIHSLANVGEALQAGGRAGKEHLRKAFIDCWPLTAFLVFKHEADLASSSLMGMGFVINKLHAEFGTKPELADTWPFIQRAFVLIQEANSAKLLNIEATRLEAINDASYLDVQSRGQFRFAAWLKDIVGTEPYSN